MSYRRAAWRHLSSSLGYFENDALRPSFLRLTDGIVLQLIEPFMVKGRNVTTDDFFSSLELAKQLNKKDRLFGLTNIPGKSFRHLQGWSRSFIGANYAKPVISIYFHGLRRSGCGTNHFYIEGNAESKNGTTSSFGFRTPGNIRQRCKLLGSLRHHRLLYVCCPDDVL